MLIKPMSDLHLEFGKFRFPVTDNDHNIVLVLLGDIAERKYGRATIENACNQYKHVILILGNHETCKAEFNSIVDFWWTLDQNIDNFHFLNNATFECDGVRFIGTTLWTDMDDNNPMTMLAAHAGMREYDCTRFDPDWRSRTSYQLKSSGRKLRPIDTVTMHKKAVEFIEQEVSVPYDGVTVVLTHHSPTHRFVVDEYVGDKLNGAFHANCDSLFTLSIDYWMYGHVHDSNYTEIDGTIFISNPRGYTGYENTKKTGFNPDLIIDTEAT